ncbi:hypothetical protein HGRIS_003958 [Hohenbuehelia grisea]|uniref:TEA domain-containing protein n=1 Tax=Hohenbuehelia grisea TaxID=104357 RepID=A0ABR3JH24_9AGAR
MSTPSTIPTPRRSAPTHNAPTKKKTKQAPACEAESSAASILELLGTGRKSYKRVDGETTVWCPSLELLLLACLALYEQETAGTVAEEHLRYVRRNATTAQLMNAITDKLDVDESEKSILRRTPKQVGSRIQQLQHSAKNPELQSWVLKKTVADEALSTPVRKNRDARFNPLTTKSRYSSSAPFNQKATPDNLPTSSFPAHQSKVSRPRQQVLRTCVKSSPHSSCRPLEGLDMYPTLGPQLIAWLDALRACTGPIPPMYLERLDSFSHFGPPPPPSFSSSTQSSPRPSSQPRSSIYGLLSSPTSCQQASSLSGQLPTALSIDQSSSSSDWGPTSWTPSLTTETSSRESSPFSEGLENPATVIEVLILPFSATTPQAPPVPVNLQCTSLQYVPFDLPSSAFPLSRPWVQLISQVPLDEGTTFEVIDNRAQTITALPQCCTNLWPGVHQQQLDSYSFDFPFLETFGRAHDPSQVTVRQTSRLTLSEGERRGHTNTPSHRIIIEYRLDMTKKPYVPAPMSRHRNFLPVVPTEPVLDMAPIQPKPYSYASRPHLASPYGSHPKLSPRTTAALYPPPVCNSSLYASPDFSMCLALPDVADLLPNLSGPSNYFYN